jgi:hypothetical protein
MPDFVEIAFRRDPLGGGIALLTRRSAVSAWPWRPWRAAGVAQSLIRGAFVHDDIALIVHGLKLVRFHDRQLAGESGFALLARFAFLAWSARNSGLSLLAFRASRSALAAFAPLAAFPTCARDSRLSLRPNRTSFSTFARRPMRDLSEPGIDELLDLLA